MKKILIADDSGYQRKVLSEIVRELGYDAVTVGSGEELLKVLNESIDCIFLDLLMPGMNGIDVLRALSAQPNSPPVVVISADIQEKRKQECLSLGAFAFVNKMVSKADIQNTLNLVFINK